MKILIILTGFFYLGVRAVLEPCVVNDECTSVNCRANLAGNITTSTQDIIVVFSVDPDCQRTADIFFGLRDSSGTSLFNQSVVGCFSILQQDQLEVTIGPLPDNTDLITFSLSQRANESTMLTVMVPGEPDPPLLRSQTTWFHQLKQCPDPTTTMAPMMTTTGGAANHHIHSFPLCLLLFTLVFELFNC